jgi:hypothetical protein
MIPAQRLSESVLENIRQSLLEILQRDGRQGGIAPAARLQARADKIKIVHSPPERAGIGCEVA